MRKGELSSFEELYRREFGNVLRAAYLVTGDREEARDIVQEAFARAYERWRTVSRLDRPGAWLQRVTVNLALSSRRRARMRLRETGPQEEQREADPLLDLVMLSALRKLSPAQRAVLVLRFYSDQSVENVARALGKRPATVRSLTSQGLSALRRMVPEEVRV